MWLSALRLVNFRNYRALRLDPQPGVLVFSGNNGQGKTNILESIYLLANLRSFRDVGGAQMIMSNCGLF